MIKKIALGILILMVLNANSQSLGLSPYVVANIDWIKYYSQKDAITAASSALDVNSNVYLTGYVGNSNKDGIILKYDSLGGLIYHVSINHGGYDCGKAIKIDPSGNAFVVGISENFAGTSTGRDYFIMKISPSGSILWSQSFDNGVNGIDEANDLCIDASGDVYVTGKAQDGSGNYRSITLKLHGSNGSITWSHQYPGSGTYCEGMKIAISSNGSYVFVGGNNTHPSHGSDIFYYALNASGGVSWSPVTINGTANSADKLNALIASDNDLVLCGEETNNSTGLDYITAYITGSSGSTVWSHTYGSTTADRATALVRDSAGNFGVVGTIHNNSNTYDYHTVLYSNTGTQYAVNIEQTGLYTLTGDPHIVNDTIAHHWYVAGEINKITRDIYIYQITPTGNTAWRQPIDGVDMDTDAASSIGVNGVGVVYVGAQSKMSTGDVDYTTIKLSQTPLYYPPDLTGQTNDKSFLFYENFGQELDEHSNPIDSVRFTTHSQPKYYFTPNRLSMVFASADSDSGRVDTLHRIDMNFERSNPLTTIHPLEDYGGDVLYILGQLSTPVAAQKGKQRLMIPNLYPGIDLHYYSNNTGGIKYYFVLKPGANPKDILQKFNSTNFSTAINTDEQLEITSTVGKITLDVPKAYQVNMMGAPVPLADSARWYNTVSNGYQFNLPSYVSSVPLIIMINQVTDQQQVSPITLGNLNWSTFLGGEVSDVAWAVTVDNSGRQHVAGATGSTNFPSSNYQSFLTGSIHNNSRYGFYTKFSAAHQMVLSAYIGGNDQTDAFDVKVNSNGDAYIVGTTLAYDFPYKTKAGAYNDSVAGSTAIGAEEDAFVLKISSSNTYVWGTYFGGSNNDNGFSCAIDNNDNFYLAGNTANGSLPLIPNGSAYQHAWAGNFDGYIAKFNSSDNLTWFTYLGGDHADYIHSCKTDANNNVFLSGTTYSGNFPTFRAVSGFYKDSVLSGSSDIILLKFDSTGVRKWSTFFGGSGDDASLYGPSHHGIALDSGGNLYVVDNTNSSDLPVQRQNSTCYYDSTFGGNIDGLLAKFSPSLLLRHCTYLGGAAYDYADGIALDANNNIYITYGTSSSGQTTQNIGTFYSQSGLNTPSSPVAVYGTDNFLLSLNSILNSRWATYFGGTSYNAMGDEGSEIAISGNNMYLVGYCNSFPADPSDVRFPIFYPGSPAYIDSTYNDVTQANQTDGFISKFDLSATVGIEEYSMNKSIGEISLFPNPTNSSLMLKFSLAQQEKINLSIYSVDGRQVFETVQPAMQGVNLLQINAAHLKPGVYLIKLVGREQEYFATEKFIKNE